MPSLFWSGKLTLPMKLLIDANNLLSVFTGSFSDIAGMKNRVKRGYEGQFSDHVHSYDELGFHLQDRSARVQLEGMSFNGMKVLDVGYGTGALAYVAVDQRARTVVCGDISYLMLQKVVEKDRISKVKLTNCQLDAEGLPFEDGGAAYDFFAAISASWWYAKFPQEERIKDSKRTREYFMRHRIDVITDDIVVTIGHKPEELT